MSAFSIIIVILLASVGVLGDFFIKLAGNGSSNISIIPFLVGTLIYALTAIGWFYVMKHIQLGSLGIYYSLTTVILLVFIGAVFFDEHLTISDVIGIGLGIISIVILARFG